MSTRVRCSACNAEWPASITKCYKCGQVLGAGAADSLRDDDDYAEALLRGGSPRPSGGSGGAYCDGDKLVMTEGCDMPRRCPICNSDDVSETTDLTISRETKEMGGVSGLIKAGVDKLAGWNYTGPVEVSVYFCDRHRNRFRNRLAVAAVIALVSVLYLVVAYLRFDKNQPAREYYDVYLAIAGAIGGVVMLAIWGKAPALVWFKPQRFVDRTVWVAGAGRAFLDSLPSFNKSRV